jgi:RHS repeat-associated protein
MYDAAIHVYDATMVLSDSFKYDPFGRRIYKSSSSGTSVYAYDGDNLIEETNSTGVVVARYSDGLNIDEPLAMLRSATTSYYDADGLGSVTSLSNGAGSLAQTYGYDSFGKKTSSSGSLTNAFQYTGREFDTESTLYYMRARYFDPANGRFLSEDPTWLGVGANAYVYTQNNPVGSIDPYGLDWIEYTGQRLTVYSGKFGDRSGSLEQCNATSGLPDRQSPAFQGTESGPVPAGLYKINLQLDPNRFASLTAAGDNLYSNTGVQRIRDRYPLPGGGWAIPAGWGTWRARLEKVKVNSNRDNFYLHNSTKGYTHGCVETCNDLYDRFAKYHQQGVGSILVNINYTTNSTNGGTKQ